MADADDGRRQKRTIGNHSLDWFNQQVLACQDEAFTLASYLLEDDRVADETVERAFLRVYRQSQSGLEGSIRLSVLREVLRLCGHSRTRRARQGNPLSRLPRQERSPLVLVDLLGLTYTQAGDVLGCSKNELAHRLSEAREKLAPGA